MPTCWLFERACPRTFCCPHGRRVLLYESAADGLGLYQQLGCRCNTVKPPRAAGTVSRRGCARRQRRNSRRGSQHVQRKPVVVVAVLETSLELDSAFLASHLTAVARAELTLLYLSPFSLCRVVPDTDKICDQVSNSLLHGLHYWPTIWLIAWTTLT